MDKYRKRAWHLIFYPNMVFIAILVILDLFTDRNHEPVFEMLLYVAGIMIAYLGFYRGEKIHATIAVAGLLYFVTTHTYNLATSLTEGFSTIPTDAGPWVVAFSVGVAFTIYLYTFIRAYLAVLRRNRQKAA